MSKRNPWNDAQVVMGSMNQSIRRGYQIARDLGYAGSSLDYAMQVTPALNVIDRDENGRVTHEGPAEKAPSVQSLLQA